MATQNTRCSGSRPFQTLAARGHGHSKHSLSGSRTFQTFSSHTLHQNNRRRGVMPLPLQALSIYCILIWNQRCIRQRWYQFSKVCFYLIISPLMHWALSDTALIQNYRCIRQCWFGISAVSDSTDSKSALYLTALIHKVLSSNTNISTNSKPNRKYVF